MNIVNKKYSREELELVLQITEDYIELSEVLDFEKDFDSFCGMVVKALKNYDRGKVEEVE